MKARFLSLALAGLLWARLALAQININTATSEELDGLKGIGPTKAKAIVDYRKKNGPFKSVDDLQNVHGIGPETLKDIRREVTVSGVSRPVALPVKPASEAPKQAVVAPAKPLANPASAPARPAMPGKAAEAKAAPRSDVPVKPAADARPMPAPARPAVPVVAGKVAAESKSAVPVALAAPAKPAGPATRTEPPNRVAVPWPRCWKPIPACRTGSTIHSVGGPCGTRQTGRSGASGHGQLISRTAEPA